MTSIWPRWLHRRRKGIVVHITTTMPADSQSIEKAGKAIVDAIRRYG